MSSENTILFHPGYNGPPGAFRINGPGGDGINWNMGWVPAIDVLHHVEIHSFPDGVFNIKVTDGTDPNLVYEDTFTNPAAYGGDIGFLAAGMGAAVYKNLSITTTVPIVPADYNANGVVDAADYVLWRNGGPLQNEVDNPGVVDAGDYSPWRERFGNTGGSGSALGGAGAVPEPATLAILSAAGALLLITRRRTARSAVAGGATNPFQC
jgi:hypothetical protein